MSAEDTQYAGFWVRLSAMLIDAVILTAIRMVIFGIIYLITYGILHLLEIKIDMVHNLIYASTAGLLNIWLTWLYYCLFESSSVQATPGKMAVGVKVSGLDGNRITFEKATLRYFLKILSVWSLLIGYFMAAFSSKKQTMHDILAETTIVYKR